MKKRKLILKMMMMDFVCRIWKKIKPEINQSFISIMIAFTSLLLSIYTIFSAIDSDKFQNKFNNDLLQKLDTLTETTRDMTNVFASSMSSYIQLKQYTILSKIDKNGEREISPVLTISNIGKSEAENVTISITYYVDCFKNKTFIYKFDTIPFVKVNTYFANHRWELTKIKMPVNQNKIISRVLVRWYDTRLKKNDSIVEYDRFQIVEDNKIFAIGMTMKQTLRAQEIFDINENIETFHGKFERYF